MSLKQEAIQLNFEKVDFFKTLQHVNGTLFKVVGESNFLSPYWQERWFPSKKIA
jgi:hypothetical protein